MYVLSVAIWCIDTLILGIQTVGIITMLIEGVEIKSPLINNKRLLFSMFTYWFCLGLVIFYDVYFESGEQN